MADSNSEPVICPCGFFGRPETAGLCSKCYRDQQKKTAEAAPDKAAAASVSSEAFSKAVAQVTLPTSVSASASSTTNGSGLPSTTTPAPLSTSAPTTQDDTGAAAAQPPSNGTKRDGDEESIASSTVEDSMDTPPAEASASDTSQSDKPDQKKKKRCFKCNCKLQPAVREIGRCKCDYVFCQLHRLPEQHDCIYDHKEKGRQEARDKMVSPKKHMGTSLKRIDSDS